MLIDDMVESARSLNSQIGSICSLRHPITIANAFKMKACCFKGADRIIEKIKSNADEKTYLDLSRLLMAPLQVNVLEGVGIILFDKIEMV